MISPDIKDLMRNMDSRYTLVVTAAKRARQLTGGAEPLTRFRSDKPVTLAIHEIAEGKVDYFRDASGIADYRGKSGRRGDNVARFNAGQYNDSDGSDDLAYNDEEYTTPPIDADEYDAGTEVTVTATANTGWEFKHWITPEGEVTGEEYIFTITEDVTLTAKFDVLSIPTVGAHGNFTIYPNPVNDILKVRRLSDGNAQIEIINSAGATVQSLEINGSEKDLDVSTLSSGVYMIRLIENNNISTSTLRFVKE